MQATSSVLRPSPALIGDRPGPVRHMPALAFALSLAGLLVQRSVTAAERPPIRQS